MEVRSDPLVVSLRRRAEERHSAAPNIGKRPGPQDRANDRYTGARELDGLDADVVVVEIKAAAIDVVAEEAQRRGIEVVLAGNDVLPLAGDADLDAELERLAAEAIASAMVGV